MLATSQRCLAASQRRSLVVITGITTRWYVSRAHPKPTPVFAVGAALEQVLEGVEERKRKREKKWERNAPHRARKGLSDDGGPFRNQDETIEFVLNLNLDPQKPGQALRGALTLPHGTGKTSRCVVFTESTEMAERALEMGAIHAGGEALVDSIVSGDVPLVDFDRSLASQDIMGYLSRKLARTLGPRGLMPNAKVGSLVTSPNMLETALRDAMGGQAQYRTDREGILHWGIGKGSFGHEKLLDNMRAIMEEVYAIKPETYGKGKKASKNAIYFLRAHLTATQGSSIRIDRRTIDPSSKFYFDVAPA